MLRFRSHPSTARSYKQSGIGRELGEQALHSCKSPNGMLLNRAQNGN
jgi:hypothetical protein